MLEAVTMKIKTTGSSDTLAFIYQSTMLKMEAVSSFEA
jgi:hypothetical protein